MMELGLLTLLTLVLVVSIILLHRSRESPHEAAVGEDSAG
jgi:hypothetical protein